jgi:hypothetical protein
MEAFPLGDGAELGIVRRNLMRHAGATLRLFAQWLRPTTIYKSQGVRWNPVDDFPIKNTA